MDERLRFMQEWEHESQAADGPANMSALCRAFGISRQTGYKWLARYMAAGRDEAALAEESRRPRHSPCATPQRVVDVVIGARRMFPRWGARKLHSWLLRNVSRRGPLCMAVKAVPSPTTIGAILRREGLTRPRRRRSRTPPTSWPFKQTTGPNATWCVDFKGHFRTQDGKTCYPLTVMDAYSRKLLRCVALRDPNGKQVRNVFESAFRQYGLPTALRSDNGPPFASVAPGGLSRLSVWWTRLGIRHERIQPGKPQQNGRHERMHRTLKEAATTPPSASLEAQQKVFDWFVEHYNAERPHEALGGRTPNQVYRASPRRMPGTLEPLSYPLDCEIRRVRRDGSAHLTRTRSVAVGKALAGEWIAFRWLAEQKWEVRFGPITVGIFDFSRKKMIGPAPGRMGRKPIHTTAVP
jgi:transposase InsO family protein